MLTYRITITKKEDGLAFKNKIWDGKESIEIAPVTVLTGNNGSGKTALLKAIAYGAGVDLDLTSKSESKVNRRLKSKFGVALNSFNPDEVFLHSPVDQISGRGWVENKTDLLRIFSKNQSHGEMLSGLLFDQMQKIKKLLATKRVLWLVDEPESASSLETVLAMCKFFEGTTKIQMEEANKGVATRVSIIVTTQNPEIVRCLVDNEAMRIDLGGWTNGDPFEQFLRK